MRSDIKILNLSPNELKLIAKSRGIKGYENKSEYDLIKKLSEPKTKISLSRKKIKDIKKFFSELWHRLLKSEIKERRNLYEIKNKKNLSKSKIKEIEENLDELEKKPF